MYVSKDLYSSDDYSGPLLCGHHCGHSKSSVAVSLFQKFHYMEFYVDRGMRWLHLGGVFYFRFHFIDNPISEGDNF